MSSNLIVSHQLLDVDAGVFLGQQILAEVRIATQQMHDLVALATERNNY